MSTQRALDFSAPAPASNPSLKRARPVRKRHLQRACFLLLRRLLDGPASGSELEELGGWRFGSRLCELRPFLRRECGYPWWDRARNPLPRPVDDTESDPVYRLEPWAHDAAREAVGRYFA